MPASVSSYRLKRFRSSRDPDFAAALMLYVRNTAPPLRTDSNEIAHWLDHFMVQFGNPFYVFGFYRDHQLVGFAEAVYLRNERLIVLDYLVIDQAHRRNNVFFEFVDHLKRQLEEDNPDYRYGVIEAVYGPGKEFPSQESALLTRLLKIQGFHVVRAPYYQPRLLLDDAETGMRGDLLLYSPAVLDSLSADTYMTIVRAIYYQYYLPWKTIGRHGPAKYRVHLEELETQVRRELGSRKRVQINGHKATLGAPHVKEPMTMHRLVSFGLQSLTVVLLTTAAMLGIKVAFNLGNGAFAAIFGLAIVSFIAVIGILSKNARDVLAQVFALAKHVIRKGDTPVLPGERLDPSSSAIQPEPYDGAPSDPSQGSDGST